MAFATDHPARPCVYPFDATRRENGSNAVGLGHQQASSQAVAGLPLHGPDHLGSRVVRVDS